MGDPATTALVCASVLVLFVAASLAAAYGAGWSARDKSADAELALVLRDLDVALDGLEVAKADAQRQQFASAGMVAASRALASARRVADPVERRRLLLGAPSPAPPSPGPPAPGREAAGPGA